MGIRASWLSHNPHFYCPSPFTHFPWSQMSLGAAGLPDQGRMTDPEAVSWDFLNSQV